MPLNHELLECGASFSHATTTSSSYRLYALQGTVPAKPGLAQAANGAPIAVEVWNMPITHFGRFVAGIPAPLGIGSVTLADGRTVKDSSVKVRHFKMPLTSLTSADGAHTEWPNKTRRAMNAVHTMCEARRNYANE